jgi:hypothetical protein
MFYHSENKKSNDKNHSENKKSNDKRIKIELSSILCSSTCGVGYLGLRPS